MDTARVIVSVVVATNRGGRFLDEALRSVEAQTLPGVELILVDDGCPRVEDIDAVLAAHPEVRLIRQAASGVSIARNVGAANARGEFLAFLDDDDRWHPNRLAAHVQAHRREPDAVLTFCGMTSIDEAGRVIAPADQRPLPSSADVLRDPGVVKMPNCVVTARSFARTGGFDSDLIYAEDLDLVIRLARLGSFAFVPEALVDYRAHGGNTVRNHRELVESIDTVLAFHRRAAQIRSDSASVRALRAASRSNARYAWWTAVRTIRRAGPRHRAAVAVRELAWAARTAPLAPFDAAVRRLRTTSASHP